MTRSVSRSLTQWKHCSLSIGITSDSVHNRCKYMTMSGILVRNISDCLQIVATYFIEIDRGKRIGYYCTGFWRNFERTYGNLSPFARQWCQFRAIFRLRIRKRNPVNSILPCPIKSPSVRWSWVISPWWGKVHIIQFPFFLKKNDEKSFVQWKWG